MTGINEARAEIENIPSGDEIPWQKIADKHGVVRSTLTRNVIGETRPQEDWTIAQRKLSPEQEEELVKYIINLTEHHLPPTRQMTANFASEIAQNTISNSWVTRFLEHHCNQLISKWTNPMTAERHKAESYTKYKEYFNMITEKIAQYKIEEENTYNMGEKGFMIGVIGKQKRVFAKSAFERK
jgi:hypothetical protein